MHTNGKYTVSEYDAPMLEAGHCWKWKHLIPSPIATQVGQAQTLSVPAQVAGI